ncbi:hypothetical protein ACQCX5_14405 [Propionibacteriaceae bacterium G57]|uniref:hypothetical protein n=1 Tax=Aestuariimicrobium sp. G57 TaxID=3418485 RepID=UPI003DA7A096
MGVISDLAAALAADLGEVTGWRVVDHVPARVAPPVVILASADPWLTPGDTFGTWQANYEAQLVAGIGTNDVIIDALAGAAVAILAYLPDRWAIAHVSAPWRATINDAEAPVVTIPITATITL